MIFTITMDDPIQYVMFLMLLERGKPATIRYKYTNCGELHAGRIVAAHPEKMAFSAVDVANEGL